MFSDNERAVLKFLLGEIEADLATVAEGTALARSSAHKALMRLVDVGAIESTRYGKTIYRVASRDVQERAIKAMADEFRTALKPQPSTGRKRLVFTDSYVLPETYMNDVRERFEVVSFDSTEVYLDQEKFLYRSRNAEVIVRYDNHKIDRDFLRQNPTLKAIVCPACYPLDLDFEACEEFRVDVVRADPVSQRYYTSAQVQYAVHAVLDMVGNLAPVADPVRWDWHQNLSNGIAGKRIGLMVGPSNVNNLVTAFRALNCEVAGAGASKLSPQPSEIGLRQYVKDEDLWDWADVLIIIDGVESYIDNLLARPRVPPMLVMMSDLVVFDAETLAQRTLRGDIVRVFIDVFPTLWRANGAEMLARRIKSLLDLEAVTITPERAFIIKDSMDLSYAITHELIMSLPDYR